MSLRISLLCLAVSFLLLPVCAQSTASYDGLVQEGNRQLQAGNLTDALAAGNQAIALDRGRWQGYALAGGALMNLKRYEEAADSLSKAIDRAPSDKQAALRELRKQCALSEAGTGVSQTLPKVETPPKAATSATQAEIVLWKSIESSSNQTDFQEYLKQYPNGTFAGLAQVHLSQLQAEDSRRKQQEEELGKQRAAIAKSIYNAGASFIVNYEGLITNSIAEGKLTITPNGVVYSGEGKPPHHAFSASCADLTWSKGGRGTVRFLLKSTNVKISLFPRNHAEESESVVADPQNEVLKTLQAYCGERN